MKDFKFCVRGVLYKFNWKWYMKNGFYGFYLFCKGFGYYVREYKFYGDNFLEWCDNCGNLII